MVKKKRKEPLRNSSHSPTLGIPEVLMNIQCEKISVTIPVKVQLSLKNYLLRIAGTQGISAWVREAIIMRLRKEAK